MVLEMKKTFSKQVKQSKINNINVKDIINGKRGQLRMLVGGRYMSQYESRINKENIKRSNIEIYNLLNKSNGYENFINTVSSLKLTLSSIIDAKVYEDTLIVFAEGIVITNKGLIANTVGTNNMALTTKVNGKYISKNIVIAKMFCEGTGRVCYKDGNRHNLSANNLYFSSTITKKPATKKKIETSNAVTKVIEKKATEVLKNNPVEKEDDDMIVKFDDKEDRYSMINANIRDLIISNFDYRTITDPKGYNYNAVSVKDAKVVYYRSNTKEELLEGMRKYIMNRYCGMLTKYGLNIMGARYDNGKIVFTSHGTIISISPKIPESSETKFILDTKTGIKYNKYEWEAKRNITPFIVKAKEIESKEALKNNEKTFASMVANNELKNIGPEDIVGDKHTIIVDKEIVSPTHNQPKDIVKDKPATIVDKQIVTPTHNQPDDTDTVGVEKKICPFENHDISEACTIGNSVIFSNGDTYDFEGNKTDGILITSNAVIAELYRKIK